MKKHTTIITNQNTAPAFVWGGGKQLDDHLGTSWNYSRPLKLTNGPLTKGHFKRKMHVFQPLPSMERTYPTLGRGTSSSKVPLDMRYVGSQEGIFQGSGEYSS